jgi:hypothetical protein
MAGTSPAMTNETAQDELAQLEAERDRLLSMLAYHNRSLFRGPAGSPAPAWFVVVAVAGICGIGFTILAGAFAGQISASSLLFLVVGLPLLAYILTRKTTVFGLTFHVFQIVTLAPGGPPAGEPEARQRLADCEARIMELKGGRS